RVKPTGLAIVSGGSAKIVGIQTWFKNNDKAKSFHCRFKDSKNDRHQEIQIYPGCPKYAVTKFTECLNESGRHKWYGVAPYVSFKADSTSKEKLFNQMSFWGLVNKAPNKAKLPGKLALGFSNSGKFTFSGWGKTGKLEGMNEVGMNSYNGGSLLAGLNAFSRAQVYYHRPGAWAEPPNLFNPFWRAKLGPVSRGLDDVLGKVGGVGGAAGNIIKQGLTH
ncbi:MAG: hypothetical protein ACK4N5_15670, partial [Myxococcales bacterium]